MELFITILLTVLSVATITLVIEWLGPQEDIKECCEDRAFYISKYEEEKKKAELYLSKLRKYGLEDMP